MRIDFENIVLRDMLESDIEDYVRWFTVEREWENWDAPWEKEDTDEETERTSWREYYESVKELPDDVRRWKFEIEWNGRHIGWVSSYCIDENYEWIGEIKEGQIVYRAIGIDICEPDACGKGIGTNALRAFVNYYFDSDVDELYTQTWSGNVRMIRCAERLGFVECNREIDFREVSGQKYDGLTFRLGKEFMHSYMVHPARWRETCDPFTLNFTDFKISKILGYPHAGNDVFHVRGVANGNETTAYIKVARQKDAAIDNEVKILAQLDGPVFPKVLDYDRERGTFSVTGEMPGLRLSAIVGDNEGLASLDYMEEYGEMLGRIHKMTISAKTQADRRFFHRPDEETLEKLDLQFLSDYFDREPLRGKTVFCHGDFHYANVLWENRHISAILDFELAGYGDRDFDIAWALFLRPGQKFLKAEQEFALFLKGYQKNGDCDIAAIRYYMAQCYVYFLRASKDKEYCEYVRNWLKKNCGL